MYDGGDSWPCADITYFSFLCSKNEYSSTSQPTCHCNRITEEQQINDTNKEPIGHDRARRIACTYICPWRSRSAVSHGVVIDHLRVIRFMHESYDHVIDSCLRQTVSVLVKLHCIRAPLEFARQAKTKLPNHVTSPVLQLLLVGSFVV